MNDMENIGDRIRFIRKYTVSLSLQDLSDASGVTLKTLRNIENKNLI